MRWTVIASPIGDLAVAVDDDGVRRVAFEPVDVPEPAMGDEPTEGVRRQLTEYFAGRRTDFDLPLSVRPGSDFERAVWAELSRIPYGQTRTYGEVAAAAGDAGAARAVGVACNRNPLPIIVPCHRVVGAGNRLVGFGGGLPRKRFLLDLESGVAMRQAWG